MARIQLFTALGALLIVFVAAAAAASSGSGGSGASAHASAGGAGHASPAGGSLSRYPKIIRSWTCEPRRRRRNGKTADALARNIVLNFNRSSMWFSDSVDSR
jgi:hypothetical protein